jgi:hypothetical protein
MVWNKPLSLREWEMNSVGLTRLILSLLSGSFNSVGTILFTAGSGGTEPVGETKYD